MSAYTYAVVRCDGWIASSETASGKRTCPATVESGARPDGSWVSLRTKPDARREAKARGWSRVSSPLGAAFAKDFCPRLDHTTAPEASR